MSKSVLLGALLTLGAAACLTVETSNGLITGHAAPNISSISEFLGVPFAQSPVGSLRFAPPQAYNGTAPYVAASYGYDCPDTSNPAVGFTDFTPQAQQVINYFSANSDTPQGEDCLTLNIWTPVTAPENACGDRPVLVFFYGGRFTYGHTNSPFFDSEFLANAENVVVVAVNYRDNIFGFPGAPGIVQNPGLRDQRLAIEWLQDNVASFGGNASHITLFGQSAGAVAIDYWAYAYIDDPIVSGLISESGNAESFPLNTENRTISNWYNVTTTLGCGASPDSLTCMLTKNWTDIKAAAAKAPSGSSGNPLRSIPAFYPTPDNETVFANYSDAGAFAKLPYLLGNNDFEQGYYALPSFKKNNNITIAEGDSFLLSSFTCPNEYQAGVRAANDVPVWLYRYFGDWPNINLYPTNNDYPGQVVSQGSSAYHGAELEMVFGNSLGVSGLPNTADENETIALIQGAWAAFARDPANGLTYYGWPQYNRSADTLILLAYNNSPTAEFVDPNTYFAACANYTPSA
ncbi:hypothetical protein LTR56_027140 [Elasticomyces elasticus]|nr:hypothetical protein LTR56_027140 [Elasticomyces elasticus]KAK3623739.1 hypothetical protein LTR22_024260 [Elasticomyces elasticus]KAK4899028.1 hypothetical protein LTR49_027725 [Elasticomyces elasticus]KAK5744103.1 hypothetical protein LTS12_023604 [Elasticomyces elasticus]